jgi:hypothetical protein
MIRDLRTIIDGWEYEPGKISVRKIIGRDGGEKIQTRIDLGVLQLEIHGRPDGRRPRGASTLLEYQENRLVEHLDVHGDDEEFVLSAEDCAELRHEAYLFYQRYLSQFVLEDFEAVERDTAMTLRLIDLSARYGASEADRVALRSQKSYVLMMNARARTCRAMRDRAFESALAVVDAGLKDVRGAQGEDDTNAGPQHDSEIQVLEELRAEIIARMPADTPAKLRVELNQALEREDYERAAELRDRIACHNPARRVG